MTRSSRRRRRLSQTSAPWRPAASASSWPGIAGHLGRLGTRDDVTVHQQYIADIEAGAKAALGTVDPTPYF
jgi:hypothetical protein